MRTKLVFPSALLLAVVGAAGGRAQELPSAPVAIDPTRVPAPVAAEALPPAVKPPPTLSNWITYTRPDCCGPIGGDGPIRTELFVRAGPSLPVQGAIWGHVLDTGWDIEGGGRSLFYNAANDAAWTVGLSLSNIQNQGQHADRKLPFGVFLPSGTNPFTGQPTGVTEQTISVTVRNLNRTFVSAAFGREWYLTGAPHCGETSWRFGVDGGPRLGTMRLELYELQHRTDVLGAAFASIYTDVEIPRGCCTFLIGFRAEWDYNFADILGRGNDSDFQDVNLLLNVGVKF